MGAKAGKHFAGSFRVDFLDTEVAVYRTLNDCRKQMEWCGGPVIAPWPEAAFHGMSRRDEGDDGRAFYSVIIHDDAELSVVVHESVHMADELMYAVGIPSGRKNTEVRARLTELVFRRVNDILPRKRAK